MTAPDAHVQDPGGRDAPSVAYLDKCTAFFKSTKRIPADRSTDIRSRLRQIQRAIVGRATPRNAPPCYGNWQVEERLGGTDRYTEYRARHTFLGARQVSSARLRVYPVDPYLPDAERTDLVARIRELGADPFDYRPLPAQMSMFNAMEALPDTCQRLAGFSMGGEGIANYLIEKCLAAPSVPDWIKAPYRRILADEEGHGSGPEEILERYATTPDIQDATRRAVAMRLVLMREYLGSLDRWAMNEADW